MNVSKFTSSGSVYMKFEYVKGCAYKNAPVREKSALLPVICANFDLLREYCAHFCRVECLLPTIRPV